MKKILLGFFALIFMINLGFSQYKPGYIIPSGSDTLKGFVRWYGAKVYYKPTKKQISEGFDGEDLEAFGYLSYHYQRHCVIAFAENFPEEKCGFLQVLEKGTVSLYRFDLRDMYGNSALPNFYVRKFDGRFVRVRRGKGGFKKEMSQFFDDSEDIVEGIKTKKYTYESLRQMVSDYNESLALN